MLLSAQSQEHAHGIINDHAQANAGDHRYADGAAVGLAVDHLGGRAAGDESMKAADRSAHDADEDEEEDD